MTWLIAPLGVFVGLLLALVMGSALNTNAGRVSNAAIMLLVLSVPFWAGVAVGALSFAR